MKKISLFLLSLAILAASCQKSSQHQNQNNETAQERTERTLLSEADLQFGAHHTKHVDVFGPYVKDFNNGINEAILKGIDIVQSHAMDGGGYFTGIAAIPTESPVFYNLKLLDRPLIDVPRNSSYCSGATYTAFIEALNLLLTDDGDKLTEERYEALRMQEPDGGRREDHIKFWGHWNADGFGNHFALVQYSKMGEVIKPEDLKPGDFVNISWKSGLGHSVIFLGWHENSDGKNLLYWSSQKSTNGYGDQIVNLDRIKSVKAVRLTNLDKLFEFDPNAEVNLDIPGDEIYW